ncbi:hypothetical protein HJC23_009436 [Cyclotella cryptica]|uniref:Uncharacterized protein n=1 Tax=Cyclotella cryptica TaxID=29204 RepID=A0ABD3Q147_9STRA
MGRKKRTKLNPDENNPPDDAAVVPTLPMHIKSSQPPVVAAVIAPDPPHVPTLTPPPPPPVDPRIKQESSGSIQIKSASIAKQPHVGEIGETCKETFL